MNEYFRQAFLLGLAASAALFVLMFIFLPKVMTVSPLRLLILMASGAVILSSAIYWTHIMSALHLKTTDMSFIQLVGPWLLPILIVEAFGFGYQVKLFLRKKKY